MQRTVVPHPLVTHGALAPVAFTPPSPLQRATAVAGRQFGAISYQQARARASPSTRSVASSPAARGIGHRRGLFTVAGSPATPQQATMVAYLAAGAAGGVVSHLSAAALHGLSAHPARPHVTVPPGRRSVSRVAHVHRSDVPPVDRAHRGPFTTTSVSRTLVDCAALLDRPALADLVDEAFCRKLASRASIHAAADRMGAGRRGTRLAREVAEVWSPQVDAGIAGRGPGAATPHRTGRRGAGGPVRGGRRRRSLRRPARPRRTGSPARLRVRRRPVPRAAAVGSRRGSLRPAPCARMDGGVARQARPRARRAPPASAVQRCPSGRSTGVCTNRA